MVCLGIDVVFCTVTGTIEKQLPNKGELMSSIEVMTSGVMMGTKFKAFVG